MYVALADIQYPFWYFGLNMGGWHEYLLALSLSYRVLSEFLFLLPIGLQFSLKIAISEDTKNVCFPSVLPHPRDYNIPDSGLRVSRLLFV
jgi:hypothetical protein